MWPGNQDSVFLALAGALCGLVCRDLVTSAKQKWFCRPWVFTSAEVARSLQTAVCMRVWTVKVHIVAYPQCTWILAVGTGVDGFSSCSNFLSAFYSEDTRATLWVYPLSELILIGYYIYRLVELNLVPKCPGATVPTASGCVLVSIDPIFNFHSWAPYLNGNGMPLCSVTPLQSWHGL